MLAGKIMIDGKEQFRIIGLVDKEAHKRSVTAKRRGRQGQDLSPLGAKRAFNRHYKNSPKYKSDKSRKSAKSRDLCWDNQPLVRDRRYSRSPHRYDYPGIDDGSECDSVHQYKNNYNPRKMKKGSKEAIAWGKMMKEKNIELRNKRLLGGGSISEYTDNTDSSEKSSFDEKDMSDDNLSDYYYLPKKNIEKIEKIQIINSQK